MARTNLNATRVKPAASELLTMEVLRRERLSESFGRVTVGGGDIAAFQHMGFDQWFRLFLPVSEKSLSRLPLKLDTLSYLRFMTISKTERPILRNYTVADYRAAGADGPELDIDFVLHSAGTPGPASTWAETCQLGDHIAILDEGIAFNPPPAYTQRTVLVGDESALPAIAGILRSLPRDVTGAAVVEVPHPDDRRVLEGPEGVEVRWVVREDAHAVPGDAALAAAGDVSTSEPFYGWVAGEQSLVTSMRRHWVARGVAKDAISFCGYWRHSGR